MKNIRSRLTALERNSDVITARHRQQLIVRFNLAVKAGTWGDLIDTLYGPDLDLLDEHLDISSPDDGIEWGNVTEDDLDAASRNKITTQTLRERYPKTKKGEYQP